MNTTITTRLRALAVLLASLLWFAVPASAQVALTSTTLSSALVNSYDTSMTLTSVTGFTGSTASATTYAVIDREAVILRSINTTTGVVQITRGLFGTRATGHVSGATVYYIPAGSYALSTFDRAGACSASNATTDQAQTAGNTPIIVPLSGSYFYCSAGQWVRQDITNSAQTVLNGIAQPASNSQVAGGAALTVIGGVGSAAITTTSTNGGVGGAPSIIGGVGGAGGSTSGTGGAGGSVTTTGGVGGGTITGGAGGAILSTGGAGGVGSTTSGVGGAFTAAAGAGAAQATSAGTGGAGGVSTLTGGAGGAASTGAATGGAGGATTVAGGAGGGTFTGGAGGHVTVKAGAGANGSTAGGSGGNAIIVAGAAGTGGTGTAGKVQFQDAADNTKIDAFDLSGQTTATTRTYKMPDASGGLPVVLNCGSTTTGTATCTATAAAATTKIYAGVATLASNAQVITLPVAFAATTSFQCVGNDITTRANPVQVISTSTNSITITNTTGASDVINWVCVGQ